MRNLFLIIQRKYFLEILNGLKKEEYRLVNSFYKIRLMGKKYETVTFQNGYSKNSPKLTAKFLGYDIRKLRHDFFGDNYVDVFCIKIGEIIEIENVKNEQTVFKFYN